MAHSSSNLSCVCNFDAGGNSSASLVDAVSTFTVAVVFGGGKKLFADGSAPHSYTLTSSRVSSTASWSGTTSAPARSGAVTPNSNHRATAERARQERMKREGW